MWSYNYVTSSELYHHGIKGQKWGVRRFQNEDGSLTEAGEKRYGSLENSRQRNRYAKDSAKALNRQSARMTSQKAELSEINSKINSYARKKKKLESKNKDTSKIDYKLGHANETRKKIQKAITDGKKETNKILKSLRKEGFSALAEKDAILKRSKAKNGKDLTESFLLSFGAAAGAMYLTNKNLYAGHLASSIAANSVMSAKYRKSINARNSGRTITGEAFGDSYRVVDNKKRVNKV